MEAIHCHTVQWYDLDSLAMRSSAFAGSDSPRRHRRTAGLLPPANPRDQTGGLAEDLISCAGNEAMADIIVEANDGGEIPACSFVLGARSPVFQNMLFGGNHHGRLRLDHGTNVVRTVVHYCRTNELDPVWQTKNDEDTVRELIELCDCANFFALDGLKGLVCNVVINVIKMHPHLSCAIYDEAAAHGENVAALKSVALDAIRQNPQVALLRRQESGSHEPGIMSLRPSVVEEIIGDPRMCADELTMFKGVMVWTKNSEAKSEAYEVIERRMLAKRMATNCIDLAKIPPSDLLGVVTDSGLVEPIEVTNALTQLTLRLEKEGTTVPQPRVEGISRAPTPKRQGGRPVAFQLPTIEAQDDEVPLITPKETIDSEDSLVSMSLPPPVSRPRTRKAPSDRKRKQVPSTITPERSQHESRPSKSVRSASTKSSPRRPTIGEAVGLFISDKVDTLCLQRKSYTDE